MIQIVEPDYYIKIGVKDKKVVNISWEEMFKFLGKEYDCKFDIKEYLQKAIKFMEHKK